MKSEILNRKGARKTGDIPKEVLKLLNDGEIETVNLTEWLAINHSVLIKNVFADLGIAQSITKAIVKSVKEQKKPSTMNSVKLIGSLLYENLSGTNQYERVFKNLSTHQSDSIRCYSCYLMALNSQFSFKHKLNKIKGLVEDKHFGVREVVWMSMRSQIDENLKEAITILSEWANDEDENVRRFATESTRPRGVWCKHIEKLKEQPDLALPILEQLKSDKSKYVQDSVGNWLNDASKSQPEFVINLCEKWKKESQTNETKKIIKRARRTIDKK